jgi:hypothetical protein
MIQGRRDRVETNARLLQQATWLLDRAHLRCNLLVDIATAHTPSTASSTTWKPNDNAGYAPWTAHSPNNRLFAVFSGLLSVRTCTRVSDG